MSSERFVTVSGQHNDMVNRGPDEYQNSNCIKRRRKAVNGQLFQDSSTQNLWLDAGVKTYRSNNPTAIESARTPALIGSSEP